MPPSSPPATSPFVPSGLLGSLRWGGLLLTTLAPFAAGAASPELAPLLQRLAEEDARRHALQATTDVTRVEHEEDVDRSGKAEHVVEREVRVTHPQGQEHEELVRSSRDGRDDTGELRPRFDEAQRSYREVRAKRPRKDEAETPNPFAAAEQPKYEFSWMSPAAAEPGVLRIHFQPKGERGPGSVEGEARVLETGRLLMLWTHPASLPAFVKSSSAQLTFGQQPFGPVLLESAFEGEGGMLFMTKRFRGRVTYRDFKPREAP